MRSTSYTQPAHVPPLTRCRAAHRRVSAAGRVGRDPGAAPLREQRGAPGRVERLPGRSHEVHRPRERPGGRSDLDQVVIAQPADRAACSASGPMWPTQRAAREPGETAVGRSATCSPGEISERVVICAVSCIQCPTAPSRSARSRLPVGSAAQSLLSRPNRVALVDEDARGLVAIDLIVSHDGGSSAVALITAPSGAKLPTGTRRCWSGRRGARRPDP